MLQSGPDRRRGGVGAAEFVLYSVEQNMGQQEGVSPKRKKDQRECVNLQNSSSP